MLNALVINNDPILCKRIVNGIMQYAKNIRVCGISYTVKEAIQIIEKQKIDIVILDYDMPRKVALNFIDYFSKNEKDKNMYLILFAKESEIEKIKNSCIFKIINKPIELSKLICVIRNICNKNISLNQIIIKNKINNELEKLQYNFSYVGTQYMSEAIYEIYSKNYIYTGGNLNKNVYPIIAENHKTTINNVKCSITAATKMMAERCPKEIMEKYLFYNDTDKPTVKEIMYKVINRL